MWAAYTYLFFSLCEQQMFLAVSFRLIFFLSLICCLFFYTRSTSWHKPCIYPGLATRNKQDTQGGPLEEAFLVWSSWGCNVSFETWFEDLLMPGLLLHVGKEPQFAFQFTGDTQINTVVSAPQKISTLESDVCPRLRNLLQEKGRISTLTDKQIFWAAHWLAFLWLSLQFIKCHILLQCHVWDAGEKTAGWAS